MNHAVFISFDAFDFENHENFQKGWMTVKTLIGSDDLELEYLRAKAFFFSKYIQSFDFDSYLSWKTELDNTQQCLTITEDRRFAEGKSKGDSDVSSEQSQSPSDAPNRKADEADRGCIEGRKEMDLKAENGLHKDFVSFHIDERSSEGKELTQNKKQTRCLEEALSDIASSTFASSQSKDFNAITHRESEEQDSLSLTELAVLIQNGLPIPGLISVDVEPTNKDPTPSSMTRRSKPWELKEIKGNTMKEVEENNSEKGTEPIVEENTLDEETE